MESIFVVMGTRCDCGLHFIVVMMFLHDSDGDCGFTTTCCSTFYKAAGLVMGEKLLLVDKKC